MSADTESLLAPNDDKEFEQLCQHVLEHRYKTLRGQAYARSGCSQHGVDFYIETPAEAAKGATPITQIIGIQCKHKDRALGHELTIQELNAEVQKAKNFRPPLTAFIIATSAPTAKAVQDRANELTAIHALEVPPLFPVTAWFWEKIRHEFAKDETLLKEVAQRFYPHLRAAFNVPLKRTVQITINEVELEFFDNRIQAWLKHALADICKTDSSNIEIRDQKRGSTKVTVEVPADVADRLEAAIQRGDPELLRQLKDLRSMVGPLHQLNPPVADFTGREASLAELREKVKQGGVAITGVGGMGGAGKTELARRLAAELKADYPDAQLELDLKGISPQPLSPADVLSTILRIFHPTTRLPESAEELASLFRQTFEGKRALLLLDNASDARQIAPLLPPPPGCLVIVTSRQHFILPGLDSVNLGMMELPEARALLLQIEPRIGPMAEALAESCGGLPLALRLAASFLAVNKDLAPADYIRQLCDTRQRFGLLDKEQDVLAEDLGLEALFALSFQQLPTEQQQRFTQLAVFPTSFERAAAAAVWRVEESVASEALDRLLRLSLLEWNEETHRFELHDLLREFASSQANREALNAATRRCATSYNALFMEMPDGLFAAKRKHAEYFIRVGERADELFLKGGEDVLAGLALFDRERGHLEAAFDWLEPQRDKESAPLLISLVDGVVYTSNLRFHLRQRIRWLEAQVKAVRLVGDRWQEGNALGNLGNAYADLGDTRKAIEFYEQQLVIEREIGDGHGEGIALSNLGSAYAGLSDVRKAIEFYEQHLAIARKIGDRHGEGTALGNLGYAYAPLGDARKAIEFYEQQLVIARELGDRHGEGTALGNLGNAYADLGCARKAIEYYKQRLVIALEIGDRCGEIAALCNLGVAYVDLGDACEAIEWHCQGLIKSRELGDRSGEGGFLGNLGIAYAKLGEARKAIEFYDQALAIARELGDPRGEANAFGNLGIAYADLGEARKANESHERDLAIRRKIGDRRGEGNALANLGIACTKSGEAHKAIEFFDQSLVIFHEIGDPRGEANALWYSTQALEKLGELPRVIARAEAALRIYEAIEDPKAAEVPAALAEWRKTEAGS